MFLIMFLLANAAALVAAAVPPASAEFSLSALRQRVLQFPPSAAAWRPEILRHAIPQQTAAQHANNKRLLQDVGSGADSQAPAVGDALAQICVTQGLEMCLGYILGYCEAGALPAASCAALNVHPDDFICAAVSLIAPYTAGHGAPFITEANCQVTQGTSSRSVQLWSVDQVGFWAWVSHAALGLPISAMFTFTSQHIDGVGLRSMQEAEMRALGFTVGQARGFVEGRDQYFIRAAKMAPSQIMDLQTMRAVLGPDGPSNVSVTVNLLKLNDVDQESFAFEVEFDLMISWEDNRIDGTCESFGADGSEVLESDVCSSFWKPTFLWPNAIDAVKIVEDSGLSTFVGRESNADLMEAAPGVDNSFGFMSYKVVGKFQGLSLSYERFPYDSQSLTFMIRAPNPYPTTTLNFLGAIGMADSDELAEPADWKVEAVTVDATPYRWSIPANLLSNPDSPLFAWLSNLPGFSFDDNWSSYAQLSFTVQISRKSQYVPLLPPTLHAHSEARVDSSSFTLHVARCTWRRYMLWNFVILISMLVWLSFLTFFFAPDAIDVRLSVALTVILAINVYQIVLVDMMPATGYLTDMHAFALAETVLVIVVAIENLVVYETNKRWNWKEAIISNFKRATSDSKGKRALAIIENAARVRTARRNRARTAPAVASATKVVPINQADDTTWTEPPPSPPPSPPSEKGGKGRRRPHSRWRVASMRLRAASDKPLDRISRWASQNLDSVSLIAMPVLYAFTVAWSFGRAFDGGRLADILSGGG